VADPTDTLDDSVIGSNHGSRVSPGLGVDMDSMSGPERPLREFVGLIWIADEPGLRLSVMAHSVEDARAMVVAEHGEGHAISLWNEEDASKPRSPGIVSESVEGDESCGEDRTGCMDAGDTR
jgi:hypothetical protein